MTPQQLDSLKAEIKQILSVRIERPIDQIKTSLAHLEHKINIIDERLEKLEGKPPYMTGRPE